MNKYATHNLFNYPIAVLQGLDQSKIGLERKTRMAKPSVDAIEKEWKFYES